jgi:tetratricopeptide (TPR) repeat protein
LLATCTVIAYSGSLRNGFVWDDNYQIVKNPFLHSDQPVTKLLFSDVWGYVRGGQEGVSNYYRPLQMLTYRFTNDVAGMQAAAFHGVNLLFQFLASFAGYLVMYRLTKRANLALAAAVIFTLHPLHSEAVLWIAALTELGCALFYFLAFWFFLLATEARDAATRSPATAQPAKLRKTRKKAAEAPPRPYLWLACSCISFLFAILWKEMALTFPAVIAAYVFIVSPRDGWLPRLRDGILRSLPFWGVTLLYVALRIKILGYFSRVQHQWSLTPLQFAANVVRLAAQYCWRLLWPVPLNAWYPFHAAKSVMEPLVIVSAIALVLMIVAILYGVRRASIAAFCGAWILITLTPVLNLQGIGENVFAERYLYIPSLGFCLLIAMLGSAILERIGATRLWQSNAGDGEDSLGAWLRANAAAVALVGLIALAATVQLRARTVEWRTSGSLYEAALRVAPDAPTMRNNFAQELRTAGDLDQSQQQYEEALRLSLAEHNDLQAANAYSGLAGIAWQRGESEKALELVHRGEQINSTLVSLSVAEGVALTQLARFPEAKRVLLSAIRLYPNDEIALNALGVIALNERDYGTAIHYFSAAVDVLPTFAEAYNNLGQARLSAGMVQEAIAPLQRSVELQPLNAKFATSYGAGLAKQGRLAEARAQFQRALQLDPNYSVAAYNLKIVDRMAAGQ